MNFKKKVTIALTAGALTALAVPAMAEITPYASVRMTTFYNTLDTLTATSNTDFEEGLQSNSRFGVNFTTGDIGGKVELGVSNGGVSTRHMYGTYKFGMGTLLIGQTENPYYFTSSSVAKNENVSNGLGSLWDTRSPQIKFTMNNGLYVAAITPTTPGATAAAAGYTTNTGATVAPVAAVPAVSKSENYLPKMNVGYEGKAGNFAYGAGAVGQSYKNQTASGANTDAVTSLMGYFHGTLVAGPAEIKFNLGVGQNMGNMGFVPASSGNAANKNIKIGSEDTMSYEGFVQGTYTLTPMVKVAAGIGYAYDDNDMYAKNDNRMQLFVNAPITVAKGFSITPEFSFIDQLDDKGALTAGKYASVDGQKEYLVGAKWQMNF